MGQKLLIKRLQNLPILLPRPDSLSHHKGKSSMNAQFLMGYSKSEAEKKTSHRSLESSVIYRIRQVLRIRLKTDFR